MGNRAIVVFADVFEPPVQLDRQLPGYYLHWNGGPESVYAFLDYVHRQFANEGRSLDATYVGARFAQVVGNFMGGILSLGLVVYDLDKMEHHGDNGVYIVEFHRDRPPDSDGFVVRRFVENAVGKLYELSAAEVAAERAKAARHDYHYPPRKGPRIRRRLTLPGIGESAILKQIAAENDQHFKKQE